MPDILIKIRIIITLFFHHYWQRASWCHTVKSLSAMHETRVPSMGREDPLEKEMATHSSILAWKMPWTEEPGGLQSLGLQKVGPALATEQ